MRRALLFVPLFLLPILNLLSVLTAPSVALAEKSSLSKIHPVSYRKLTPGESSSELVLKEFGQPYRRTAIGDSTALEFGDNEFEIALVTIAKNRVESIALLPTEPRSLRAVADRFDLNEYSPTAIYDESEVPIGMVIPERGIVLGLSNEDELKVREILFEAIDGESFYLRASQDQSWRLRKNLDDLKHAQRYGYSKGKCLTLSSRFLELAGESSQAFSVAEDAVDSAPQLLRARLQLASLMPQFGKSSEAVTIANSVLKSPNATEFEMAWAQCISAAESLNANKSNPRTTVTAMETAIARVANHMVSGPIEMRSLARDIHIRARLSLMDIYASIGAVKRTSLKRMCYTELKRAEQNAVGEQGNPILAARIVAHVSKIRDMQGWSDLDEENSRVIRALTERVKTADDPLLSQALRLEIASALLRISHHAKATNKLSDAVGSTEVGLKLLKPINKASSTPKRVARIKGELLYTAGLLEVIAKKNHTGAIKFYSQARPWLTKASTTTGSAQAQLGDIWVSIGVSYWSEGKREQAIEDTLTGLKLLKQAVASKSVDRSVLQTPFNNLETMYRKMGNNEQALQYRLEIANLKKATRLR